MAFGNYLMDGTYTIVRDCTYSKQKKYLFFDLVVYKDVTKIDELSSTRYNLTISETHTKVIDKDLMTPPETFNEGDFYYVASNPSGAWKNNAGQLAYACKNTWCFLSLRKDEIIYVADEDKYYRYDEKSAEYRTNTGILVEKANVFDAYTWDKYFDISKIGVLNNSDLIQQIYTYLKTRLEFSNVTNI